MNKRPATLYNELQDQVCLNNAQTYGRWTVPYLTENIAGNLDGKQRYIRRDSSSVGALLVNTLASKLTNVLFPLTQPFFKATVTPDLMKSAKESGNMSEQQIKDRLILLPQKAQEYLYRDRGYAALTQAARHLIITGNVCLHRDQAEHRTRVFGLANFVIQRDSLGRPLQAVIRDPLVYEALPPDIQKRLAVADGTDVGVRKGTKVTRYWHLQLEYRHGRRGYSERHFVNDIEVQKANWYPELTCPWVFPVWNLVAGEHYAHGHVEDYSADFRLLSRLTAGSLEYAMVMMRAIFLVGPSAGTKTRELQNAENGEYVYGDPGMVLPVELVNGANKLAQVDAKIEATLMRLSKAFMYSGNTRDAERVNVVALYKLD